jgi:hypothetical protein
MHTPTRPHTPLTLGGVLAGPKLAVFFPDTGASVWVGDRCEGLGLFYATKSPCGWSRGADRKREIWRKGSTCNLYGSQPGIVVPSPLTPRG